jgi:uncharacterized protein (TIRG00374 family)
VGIWFLEALSQWWIFVALGGDVPFLTMWSFTALSFLAGFVSFLPGGLGSREAALAALLVFVGENATVATTSALAVRAGQTVIVLALGVAAALAIAYGRRSGAPGAASAPVDAT